MFDKFRPYLVTIIFIAGIVFYGSRLLDKARYDYAEQNKALSRHADERLKKVSDALIEEKRQHEEIVQRMQQEYEKNKEEYENKLRNLEKKKSKEVSSFVSNHGDDPKSMSAALSKSTGFKVYNGK